MKSFLTLLGVLLISSISAMASESKTQETIPFPEEMNVDGALFVNLTLKQAHFVYSYHPAADFPKLKAFEELKEKEKLESNDVLWWEKPSFVAVYKSDDTILSFKKTNSLGELIAQRGKPRRFRFKHFPFTKAQDADGARFVHFIYGKSDNNYNYMPAQDYPKSKYFKEVSSIESQDGDVTAWGAPLRIGIFSKKNQSILTGAGQLALDDIKKSSAVKFYRYRANP